MSWHFLQGQEAGSWEESSLDGAPSALLRLIPMPAKSSSPASGTASLNHSRSGMTLQPSTGQPGAATLTSSPAASPAKTFLEPILLARALKGRSPGCGLNSLGLLARFDRDSSSWKTPQTCLIEGSDEFSGPWPRWGMWDATGFSVVQAPAWIRTGKGSGFLRRPQAKDGRGFWTVSRRSTLDRAANPHRQMMLIYADMNKAVANPPFWESLTGLPIGWTALEPLAISSFPAWLRLHSRPSAVA